MLTTMIYGCEMKKRGRIGVYFILESHCFVLFDHFASQSQSADTVQGDARCYHSTAVPWSFKMSSKRAHCCDLMEEKVVL